MRQVMAVLLLACSACLAAGIGQPPTLDEAIAAFYRSIETGDAEARVALLADDIVLMPDHGRMKQGREAVAAVYRRGAGSVFLIRDRQEVERLAADSLAVTVNAYAYTWHMPGDSAQWHRTKNVHVWRRDAEGDWRLALDIWNSDVPAPEFLIE